MVKYPFRDIEQKWQKRWEEEHTFRAEEDARYPKEKRRYILDMFPYPSGAGLHVGHPEGYTATDIYSRYLRMNGYNVLHPMGFDAFWFASGELCDSNWKRILLSLPMRTSSVFGARSNRLVSPTIGRGR